VAAHNVTVLPATGAPPTRTTPERRSAADALGARRSPTRAIATILIDLGMNGVSGDVTKAGG
jgi:hypothetical protein